MTCTASPLTKKTQPFRGTLAFSSTMVRCRFSRDSGTKQAQSRTQGSALILQIVVPPEEARDFIHDLIYKELALGDIRETSRRGVLEIIDKLAKVGAAGIVLANTELPLLIRAEDTRAMVFDSMAIHVNKAISLALPAEAV